MVKQYGDLYLDTRRALLETENAQDAGVLARMLVCHVSGKSQAEFLAERDMYASEKIVAGVEAALKRLLNQEPIAYILGQWEFYGLPMRVNPNVLIPRDDTCAVAELAIRQALFLEKDPRILDLCCGSGCIGLAIASRVKDAKVTLADLSLDALAVAKENTALNKLSGRVRCIQADALKPAFPFLGRYDMIVSNPPYITGEEMKELPRSVADYEPHMALYGGEDGLDFYRSIVKNFAPALKPGGYLAFEFGDTQGDDVCRILEENGYTILERSRDYNDRERAVLAQYGRKEDD
ncbi:MAG: peptide chain release factor N(5)-glutamine methyltransferase [Oscillospiraceae bacterium]|nr:peptide chain release factor N(5)-glutamine methyltransferase [Oscillospiraceae bacterium]